jgi:membrane-bound lytic murein transglycosylase B
MPNPKTLIPLFLLAALTLTGCGSTPTKGEGPRPGTPGAGVSSGPSRGGFLNNPAAQQFIDRMVAQGFNRAELTRTLGRAEHKQWIIDEMDRAAPRPSGRPTGSWTRYRAKFLTQANISNGAAFWDRNAATLARAEAKYGVPAQYVVGILGVETRWGAYMGKTRIIDALATLAFDYPRRSAYFTDELEQFLVMTRDERIDPFQPVGSFAGAMGLGQFMPGSFHKYAVDFDGNGHRNLWDVEDAIGSVANYFASHGWRRGEPVAMPARATSAVATKAGFDTRYSLASLQADGITPVSAVATPGEVSLLRLDVGSGYDYWIGFHNFYVITRYNHSTNYAMAVFQLGQAIKARRGAAPATAARNDDPPIGDRVSLR